MKWTNLMAKKEKKLCINEGKSIVALTSGLNSLVIHCLYFNKITFLTLNLVKILWWNLEIIISFLRNSIPRIVYRSRAKILTCESFVLFDRNANVYRGKKFLHLVSCLWIYKSIEFVNHKTWRMIEFSSLSIIKRYGWFNSSNMQFYLVGLFD